MTPWIDFSGPIHAGAREGEQDLLDEGDRRRGAFDIGDDGVWTFHKHAASPGIVTAGLVPRLSD
jgi:hypothetical protein